MEPFSLELLVIVGFVPLIMTVHRMTRGRPLERYERRGWAIAVLCASAALAWLVFRVLRLFSSDAEIPVASRISVLTQALTSVMLATALPALVALTLTIIATRRHRVRTTTSSRT